MGFLGTKAGPFADLTLIISIASFIILCLSIVYAKRKILSRHFRMARIAMLLLIIAFTWMAFRFIGGFYSIVSRLTALPSLAVLSHVVIGAPALILGIFLAFDRMINKTRYPMRTVFLLWILALFLGIGVYIVRYILMTFPPR
ncbi:Uncharacterised protein [uncultured archaeon]|nr:Uncharacterised protein [uncultured archaeon]